MDTNLIFSKSKKGRKAYTLPKIDVPDVTKELSVKFVREEKIELPEVSENELYRHLVKLSNKNFHIDVGMYPLGSCTMKYNPKVNEVTSRFDNFLNLHPLQSRDNVQGSLEIIYKIQVILEEISGFDQVSMSPAAGAHGEFAGILAIRKYHESRNEIEKRRKILVPDSAHGTNPASASMCGFDVVSIESLENGQIDIESLKDHLGDDIAGMMITMPNTVGIFEEQITEISKLVHECGGLMYMDGANLNAIMGIVKPGDIGFDVMHFNLHKTFSTPHGGGGPGSGPVGVNKKLSQFLPSPIVEKEGNTYKFAEVTPDSIGKMLTFWGNFAIIVRAYTYLRMLGADGLFAVSKNAIINANYILQRLKDYYDAPYKKEKIMHEAILSSDSLKKKYGISTFDVAKRLQDYNFHPPTIYFPLIVHEALMIEPTETESKENIDAFCDAMIKITDEAKNNPEIVKSAPNNLQIGRLDDAYAAKNINVCCYLN
ncbi:MAG: aminomethyl-transferring glycine dehydrogenase subunit GcvPB [Bacteroidota bacterium]|nr:aminomethyl-transferring glycine dehydrogenase subunit GcvPB [Bacteroidota bacterium]